MKQTMTVHSATISPMQMEVEHAGAKVPATVDSLVVELVAAEGGPSYSPRIVNPSAKDIALFEQGAEITVSFTRAK